MRRGAALLAGGSGIALGRAGVPMARNRQLETYARAMGKTTTLNTMFEGGYGQIIGGFTETNNVIRLNEPLHKDGRVIIEGYRS